MRPVQIIEANLFETNQLVKIEVQTGACSPPSEAVYKDVRSHSRAPFDGPVYDLVRTLSAPPDRNRRAVVAHGPRDVLIIRVNYNGVSPAYCDEDCIKQNMWATKGNSINGLFTDASYGKVTFPQALSKVVTVNIEGGIYAKASICKFWEIGLEADKAVREQFDLEPNGQARTATQSHPARPASRSHRNNHTHICQRLMAAVGGLCRAVVCRLAPLYAPLPRKFLSF